MAPCAVQLCPALATNGRYCPIHAREALAIGVAHADAMPEEAPTPDEIARAMAQREQIRRLYHRDLEAQC